MSLGHGATIIKDNMLVYFDAANPKSYPGTGTAWIDLMGNATATLVNSPTYNSSVGYFSFDGVNQRVALNGPLFNTGGYEYTLEVWFKMRTLPTAQYGANGHIWGGQNGNNLVMYLNPASGGESKFNMVYDDARYDANHTTTGTVSADEWVQWVVVGNGVSNTMTFYINGEVDKINTPVTASQVNKQWSASHAMAYDSRWNTYSTLDIAIARQYSKLLTADDVKRNYHATRGRFGV